MLKMTELKKGNIFTTECDVLVNAVNCVGVMGAGIAYECKLRFPEMFKKYKNMCKDGLLDIGLLWLYTIPDSHNHFSRVLNFPTKKDWKMPTKEVFLEKGLQKFVDVYQEKKIESVAFPCLGAGRGGLPFETSLAIMQHYLNDLPIKIEIWQYDPNAEDDLYQDFKNKFLAWDIDKIAELSGLKKDKILLIQKCLQENQIKNISGLAGVKGIGASTLEKSFLFIQNHHINSDNSLF